MNETIPPSIDALADAEGLNKYKPESQTKTQEISTERKKEKQELYKINVDRTNQLWEYQQVAITEKWEFH